MGMVLNGEYVYRLRLEWAMIPFWLASSTSTVPPPPTSIISAWCLSIIQPPITDIPRIKVDGERDATRPAGLQATPKRLNSPDCDSRDGELGQLLR
jgi:hypothetical protein